MIEARYRALTESAADAIIMIDAESRIVFVNPTVQRIFGYAPSELLDHSLMMLMPEHLRPAHCAGIRRYLESGERRLSWDAVELPGLHKSGVEIALELSFAEYRENDRPMFLGVARDITQRKRVQEALQLSEEEYFRLAARYSRLAAIVESSHDAIISTTLDGLITSWNHGAEQIYGYMAAEMVGRSLSLLVPPDGEDEMESILERIRCGERVEHFDTVRVGKNRQLIDVSLSAFPIRDSTEQVVGASTIARDITDRKRAEADRAQLVAQEREARARAEAAEALRASEAEVRRLNAELEQRVLERTAQLEAANKELEAFAYSVSHDLRGPLRAIDGFSQVLLEDYGNRLDDTAHDYLQRVRRASQRMAHLIDDMLKLSRITRTELQSRGVDLTALAWTVVSDLQKTDPERRIAIRIAEHLMARGDPHLLRVALDNLFGNAWKFTRHTSCPRIEFGTMPSEAEQIYVIRDNGAGFDMAYASKLFGAFQRLHTADEFEGTGIGLATVQRIIHRHGGRIWADSRIGEGASLYFTLGPSGRAGPSDASGGRD